MLQKSQILEAAKAFDTRRYPLEFYHHHLDVLKNAKAVGKKVEESVRDLFLWRLGKIRSAKFKRQMSDTAKPTSLKDSEGNVYYASAITEVTEDAIQNATSDDLLKRGIEFRNGYLSFGEISAETKQIVRTSIFLPSFFIHIWRPEDYPVFQKKIHNLWLTEKETSFSFLGPPVTRNRYLEYTAWFDNLLARLEIDRWTAQLGLWELGRRLEKETKGGKA